jgi:2-desacetyl-2-hydroxyethyl bacteriochlorophyllide A dehydrogenase
MKAIVKTRRTLGVEVLDVDVPRVGAADILVKVAAGSVCGSDVHIYEWTPSYEFIPIPMILGHEFAGEVVQVGTGVDKVAVGDRVSAMPNMPCGACADCRMGRGDSCRHRLGPGLTSDGFFAEYARLTAGANIFQIPDEISYDAASLLEPLSVTLNALDVSDLQVGCRAGVLGPGPIGLLTLQLVKAAGASLIMMAGTGADGKRLELARQYGADVIVDVEREDPVAKARELSGGGRSAGFDLIFEATGNPKSIPQALDMVKPGGKVYLIGIHSGPAEFDPTPMVRGRKALIGVYGYTPQTWRRAIALLSSGQVDAESMITHRLPLDRAEEGFELAVKKEAIKVIFRPEHA